MCVGGGIMKERLREGSKDRSGHSDIFEVKVSATCFIMV